MWGRTLASAMQRRQPSPMLAAGVSPRGPHFIYWSCFSQSLPMRAIGNAARMLPERRGHPVLPKNRRGSPPTLCSFPLRCSVSGEHWKEALPLGASVRAQRRSRCVGGRLSVVGAHFIRATPDSASLAGCRPLEGPSPRSSVVCGDCGHLQAPTHTLVPRNPVELQTPGCPLGSSTQRSVFVPRTVALTRGTGVGVNLEQQLQ